MAKKTDAERLLALGLPADLLKNNWKPRPCSGCGFDDGHGEGCDVAEINYRADAGEHGADRAADASFLPTYDNLETKGLTEP